MSRPNIALHKKSNVMENSENKYVKRTQKDYSMSFKLAVIKEVLLSGETVSTRATTPPNFQGTSLVIYCTDSRRLLRALY